MKVRAKRSLSVLLAFLCALSVWITAFPGVATVLAAQTAKTTDYVNLRKGPGTNYSVLFTIPKGSTVTVLDNSDDDWAKVKTSSGTQGYCSKEYLQISSSGGGSSTTTTTAKTTDYVNLRKGPGMNYDVIVTLAIGTTVTVLDDSNKDWVKVRTASGLQGYCSREYLVFSDDTKPEPEEKEYIKTTAGVNFRTGPGMNYSVIRVLPAGTVLTVVDDSDEDWIKLSSTLGPLAASNIYIDDTSGITPSQLRSRCRRLKMERGLDLIMVDYLQLMSADGRVENRQNEVSEISRNLKSIAKELNVPLIALAQLSRAGAQRSDKRPILSDLRDSGAIEQDADVIMFLHREEYYDPNTEEKNIAEVIVAKQRNGPLGTIKLAWLGQYTRFASLQQGAK